MKIKSAQFEVLVSVWIGSITNWLTGASCMMGLGCQVAYLHVCWYQHPTKTLIIHCNHQVKLKLGLKAKY